MIFLQNTEKAAADLRPLRLCNCDHWLHGIQRKSGFLGLLTLEGKPCDFLDELPLFGGGFAPADAKLAAHLHMDFIKLMVYK